MGDYMMFHSKMYEAGYMMMKEMYYMYKEHELYFNEMMDENYDWNGFVAFLGNWDYYAQKIIDMEKSYIEAEAAKCDVAVKDQRAEYGVYLTDAGERETLKCMDEHIQFYEYWSCEFDLEHMMKNNYDAAVIAVRQTECDNLPLA